MKSEERWVVGIDDGLASKLIVCDSRISAVRIVERIGPFSQLTRESVGRFLDERADSLVVVDNGYDKWGWIRRATAG